jgi:flavin-dependent dehydrogenase
MPGMIFKAKQTVLGEGPRGSLAEKAIAKFELTKRSPNER